MTIAVTESISSRRELDRRDRESDRKEQEECGLRLHLAALVRRGEIGAPVVVAEPVPVREEGRIVASCYPTLSDVLLEAFDYSTGPQLGEVLQFLINRANGGDSVAMGLIERAIRAWAFHNAEEA